MKILVSACFLGQKVRYDGKDKYLEGIERLSQYHELIPFCPEVSGGLLVPREPSEIKGNSKDILMGHGGVFTSSGEDVTSEFLEGAGKALALCREKEINTALLKDYSPSCGSSAIYDGTHKGVKIKGRGITAELLITNGIMVYSENNWTKLLPSECEYTIP